VVDVGYRVGWGGLKLVDVGWDAHMGSRSALHPQHWGQGVRYTLNRVPAAAEKGARAAAAAAPCTSNQVNNCCSLQLSNAITLSLTNFYLLILLN
jgi:hypothetical protein